MKGLKALLLWAAMTSVSIASNSEHEAVLKQLHLPYGFKISIFADDVPNARQMALGEHGTVFVGTREGNVYALLDSNGDGVADQRYTLASGLYMPNGVAYKGGALYVAEVNRILRFDEIEKHLDNPPVPGVVFDKLPSDKHHGWKYIKFGPDGKLYSAVGAPCNICNPEDRIYASLFRINADGSGFQVLGRGIRNTVGFDWEPSTHHLFFNDNGRDHLGDDVPPDELNQWSEGVKHYGFPYCHGGTIQDPEFGKDKKCGQYESPVWRYKAHIAPLGMRFYNGSQFPERYYQQLFVAQHGSWNRSEPHGYQVALVKFRDGMPFDEKPFVSGWLKADGTVSGRPVDIVQLQNGSLLISDDQLGVIYKVEYKK
ncbi:PQQ-dependent sugar dehydrogenase [Methylomonas sp. MgM2]